MLRNGLIIIIAAILLYAGIAYYLIAIFFEQHPFKVQYIYFMISLSLLFIFLQFLGGWFLQQYKSAMKSILYINSMKPEIHRWMLGYFAIKEVAQDGEKNNYIELLIALLSSNAKTFDNQIMAIHEANFAKDVFDSLNELKSTVSKLSTKPGSK